MISSKIKKMQIGLAQYLAAAVYRIHPSAIPVEIGIFPYGCFYDFAISKFSDERASSVEEIIHAMIGKERALRREMVAKNAASLLRAEKQIHFAKEAESLGSRLIYIFQLHSFFYLSREDFSVDLSRLYFSIKQCIPRGNFSKKKIPIFRIIAYTALSKKELQNLFQQHRTNSAKMNHKVGDEMDLFHFEYDDNVERIVWKEKGASLFFRLQQFWHRFLRINNTLLIEPYPVQKESKAYLNQLDKLPVSFSHRYLDDHARTTYHCLSPFPNLHSLPLQTKDCSYEFCSHRSLQKRLILKRELIESFYDLLQIPCYRKETKNGIQYFYDSVLGEAIALGFISTSILNKNISIIEYSLLHSIEIIIGVLLEHFGENLPFWLHPMQLCIMYERSQLPAIKKILLHRDITYHLQEIKKNSDIKIKNNKALYSISFFKNDEIRIRGQKNEEQKVTFFELDTLLQELEKKNCPEKLIIG